jgi:glycosyltransferase involved in cell wall biosynthesis
VLALCDELPDASAGTGNGSTMISAAVLARLGPDVEIDLVCFDDGRRRLDEALASRCRRVVRLPLRSRRASFAAMATSRLPRSAWRRVGRRPVAPTLDLARNADVLYVHGLDAFGLAVAVRRQLQVPTVAHEIDHWSEHLRQRSATRPGPRGWYDRLQGVRTGRLEQAMSALADSYMVVSADDAARLTDSLGRPVEAVPNGVACSEAAGSPLGGGAAIGFLGSLDHAPNVLAVRVLATRVLPLVRRRVPTAELYVAGRHAGPDVLRLAGNGVTVVGEVPDAAAFYRSMALMAYPGTVGTGAKNTVAEAIAAGAAVVASPSAARTLTREGQLVVADGSPAMADAVADLLLDPVRRRALAEAALRWGARLPSWEDAAGSYEWLFRQAAASARSAGG